MKGIRCSECGNDTLSSYCCCDQLFLCEDCEQGHIDHYGLDPNTMDLKNPKYFGKAQVSDDVQDSAPELGDDDTLIDKFINYIEGLINELEKATKRDLDAINSSYIDSEANITNIIHYTLDINEEALARAFKSKERANFTYILKNKSEQNRLFKLDLSTYEMEDLQIEGIPDVSNPYLFPCNECLYLIGGMIGFRSNSEIIKIDLARRKILKITKLPDTLRDFAAVSYKENIFIIGGTLTKQLQTQKTQLETTLVFNTNNGVLMEDFPKLASKKNQLNAVIHQNHLIVVFSNYSIEKLDLERPKNGFSLIDLQKKFSADFGIVSANNVLYIMTDEKIFSFVGNFKEENSKISLEHLCDIEDRPDDLWNYYSNPMHIDDTLYFFGVDYVIEYSIMNNRVSIRPLT